MHVIEFFFHKIVTLQSTAYYRIKNSTPDFFSGSAQKGKDVLKLPRFQKNPAELPLFSNFTGLQFRISVLTEKHTKKSVSCECSKLVGNLPENVYIEVI